MATVTKKEKARVLAESLAVYSDDPAGFCEDILNVTLWSKQQEALEALLRTGRVSIRSGHGVGKTSMIACLLIWAVCCRPEVEGCVTAPTFRQLTNVVFRRVESLLQRAPLLKDLVICKKTSVEFGGNMIQAATARKGEGLQGIHADHIIGSVFVIIEEASGVPADFFPALKGALSTGKAYILMVGNPTQREGFFFDSHHSKRDSWYTMRISAADSPYINHEWVAEIAEDYGEDSDMYRVRVLGEFPSVDGQSLIPLQWMEDCRLITDTPHLKFCGPTDGYVIGVDPAGQGKDSTFVSVRRGRYILGEYFARFNGMRTTEVTGYVQALYEDLKKISPISPNKGNLIRPLVCVDAIGIGSGVYHELQDAKVNVRGVIVSEVMPEADPPVHRVRDYLYWQLRELFNPENELDPVILIPGKRNKSGIIVPNGDKLKLVDAMIGEASGLMFGYLAGKIKVEEKDKYRERNGGRSPDGADSMALSFMRENRVPRKKIVDIFERSRRRQAAGQGWFR